MTRNEEILVRSAASIAESLKGIDDKLRYLVEMLEEFETELVERVPDDEQG